MTKREKQLKSMLNYYGIDMVATKDENMTKEEKKDFLDRFNSSYDAQTVQEIFNKIRDRFTDKMDNPDEENADPFFDSLKKDEDNSENGFPLDMNSFSNRKIGHKDIENFFGINPEIEKFIGWVTDLLYSADHKVVISEEGDSITHIRLEKIKKKRGGRKK